MYSPNLAIIVVDDQESGRNFARSALSNEGYEDIRLFSAATSALQSHEQRAADVIISDWVMPDMDGLALTHRVRQRDEITNHYTAVILCTAQEGIEHLVEAFEQGVDDYLNKPYKERELTARVFAAGRTVSLHNALLETIESLARSNKQLEALSTTDPLTGLGNRRYLQTQLDAMLTETASRGHPTCCAIIDLDHFKDINDRYGHDIGDEVLAAFATRIQRTVRPTDVVTRIGGEEFAVIMHYLNPAQYRPEIFERIQRSLSQRPIQTSAGEIAITASIGVSCVTGDDADISRESLLKAADEKLYQAKAEGRNRVAC
jgi:diguanylate cyclase (GGDEF)-like protein